MVVMISPESPPRRRPKPIAATCARQQNENNQDTKHSSQALRVIYGAHDDMVPTTQAQEACGSFRNRHRGDRGTHTHTHTDTHTHTHTHTHTRKILTPNMRMPQIPALEGGE